MKQGWFNDNYWIFFNQKDEILKWTLAYGIEEYFPGFGLYGFRGWDDFILMDGVSHYTVPTVPMHRKYLEKLDLSQTMQLESDARYIGKIKWYITPIILGGSASDKSNMEFIDMDQHVQFVKWWNEQLKGKIE